MIFWQRLTHPLKTHGEYPMREAWPSVVACRCGAGQRVTAPTLRQSKRLLRAQLVAHRWRRVGRHWRCPTCAALASLPRVKMGGGN